MWARVGRLPDKRLNLPRGSKTSDRIDGCAVTVNLIGSICHHFEGNVYPFDRALPAGIDYRR